jgi:hypothetical protein
MNAVAATMGYDLGGRFEILRPSGSLGRTVLRNSLARLDRGLKLLGKRFFYREPQVSPCRVVAVFSINEWERYTEAFVDLARFYGRKFQLWALGAGLPRPLTEWAESKGILIKTVSYPNKVDQDIMGFFERKWKDWKDKNSQVFSQTVGLPIFGAETLQYHFEFFFLKIWPRLAQWARKLEGSLRKAQPDWLIATSSYPPEWAFPHHVAAKLDIRSIALPHSYVQYGDGIIASKYLACRNRFERATFLKPFPNNSNVLYCQNAGNHFSYTPRRPQPISAPEGERVAALLTASLDYGGSLMPTADRLAFSKALLELGQASIRLPGVHLVLKSHPRGDITALLQEALGGVPQVMILDASASLDRLLARSWVVVLFNHYGGVLVPAILTGKPIVFVDSARFFWPETEPRAFSAGEVVADMEGFWQVMNRLKDSPTFYQELVERGRRFVAEYLPIPKEGLSEKMRSLEAASWEETSEVGSQA